MPTFFPPKKVWVVSLAETLHLSPNVRIVVPLLNDQRSWALGLAILLAAERLRFASEQLLLHVKTAYTSYIAAAKIAMAASIGQMP